MIKCKDADCLRGKFGGCCAECPDRDSCGDVCEIVRRGEAVACTYAYEEENSLATFETQQLEVLQKITEVVNIKKHCEEQEKALKEQLKSAMEKYNVKKFESDVLNITYVDETTATSIDSAKLKKLYPDIAAECSKTSKKSAYVKITLK